MEDLRHSIQYGSRNGPFVGEFHRARRLAGLQQGDGVRVVLEADTGRTDVVGHDEVESLALELRLRVGDEIEVRPGIVSKDNEGNVKCVPILSRIISLFALAIIASISARSSLDSPSSWERAATLLSRCRVIMPAGNSSVTLIPSPASSSRNTSP